MVLFGLIFCKSWSGNSLQPISHYELLQKLNPLIQKINRSKTSGHTNTVGREIQTSIREQLDLFDKRLSDLELGLGSYEQRKSNTKFYSSLTNARGSA